MCMAKGDVVQQNEGQGMLVHGTLVVPLHGDNSLMGSYMHTNFSSIMAGLAPAACACKRPLPTP